MHQFGKTILGTVLVAAISLAVSLPARADVSFTLGNNPQANEENIMLNNGTSDLVGSPSTVFGITQDTGFPVAFSSTTDMLLVPSGGQARVEASDGLLNDITITVPGGFYTDLIINPKGGSGTADVTVEYDHGTGPTAINPQFSNFSYELDNGENFLTIVADPGYRIFSTTVDASDPNDPSVGFGDLRQPRMSGIDPMPPSEAPEPCTLALLGTGALPLLRLRRRARKA
jgi:hypothetical protein